MESHSTVLSITHCHSPSFSKFVVQTVFKQSRPAEKENIQLFNSMQVNLPLDRGLERIEARPKPRHNVSFQEVSVSLHGGNFVWHPLEIFPVETPFVTHVALARVNMGPTNYDMGWQQQIWDYVFETEKIILRVNRRKCPILSNKGWWGVVNRTTNHNDSKYPQSIMVANGALSP